MSEDEYKHRYGNLPIDEIRKRLSEEDFAIFMATVGAIEIPREKRRRAMRIHINKRLKHRDRHKAKGRAWEVLPIRYGMWRHMIGEKDWQFNRRKSPTETGYGVAYEENQDAKKYG